MNDRFRVLTEAIRFLSMCSVFFEILFTLCVRVFCLYVVIMEVIQRCQILWNWSGSDLLVAMWVLKNEPGSFVIAVSALD